MSDVETVSLLELEQQHIDAIALTVPGGAENLQHVYPLAPLQEGMLFHRLLSEHSDAYVLATLFELESAAQIPVLVAALQGVMDRHDVLRTAVLWERLPRPVQVVYRGAELAVDHLVLDGRQDPIQQLKQEMIPKGPRFDLRQAPLLRLIVATGAPGGRVHAVLQVHHIICDHQSLRAIVAEALQTIADPARTPLASVPYRDYVAEVLAGAEQATDEAFFRSKLGDVCEPTAPFGLLDVQTQASQIDEARHELDRTLAEDIRRQAQRAGVTPARLFHAAWALVVARTSGKDDVVYGTVVLASSRRRAGAATMLGMFVNTLPLRLQLRDLTAQQLVERTHQELVELLKHEHTSLALAQRCSGLSGSGPLFTALFNYRHNSADSGTEPCAAAGIRVLARGEAFSNYPLAVTVDDLGEGFAFTAQSDRRVDPRRVNGYLETAVKSLIEALERQPGRSALALSVLPQDERRQVVDLFNATDAIFPREQPTHEVFEERVRHAPGALAVSYQGHALTYAQLNARANQLARYLRSRGVAAGDYVAVLMSRSLQMLVAQLAVLKSGAIYVPLDPELPPERRAFMLRDCCSRIILMDGGVPEDLQNSSHTYVDCASVVDRVARESTADLKVAVDAGAAAYVMYTSGSTGTPKGVVVPHRAVNRLAVNNGYAQIGPADCIAHHSNPTFDASTFEIWAALLNGAKMVIVPQAIVLDAQRFATLLVDERVTALYMSVGLFNQYTDALAQVFGRLTYLMLGGEALEPGAVRRVLENSAPQQLLNVYGPTECTTFATRHVVHRVAKDAKSIPIGSPISNTRIYILDRDLQPVPIAVTGEIYVGGAGVAREYLNRPELTRERFLANPFVDDATARIYKTGDLARWQPDGTVEYLGRNDHQVKIRGFRIEPAEIEAQLLRNARVRDTVVTAREDAPGDKRLVAYVVPKDSHGCPSVEELRAYLKELLPEYMIPSAFVMLERMPLTATGKVDRRALPPPALDAYMSCEYEPARGEVETKLAEIWQRLLHVAQVGRSYHFFEIGGNSLTVMRLIVMVADAFEIPFNAQIVFRNPTLMAMADAIASIRESESRQVRAPTAEEFEEGVL